MKPADGRHLCDDQMIAVYAGTDARLRDPDSVLAHLYGCPQCAARYQEVMQELAALRENANREADDIFTPARLEAQQDQIMARLEHLGHPARVIPFPASSGRTLSIFTESQVRRWIAAAAAAGLIIGLTLGRLSDFGGAPLPPSPRASTAAPARTVHTARPAADPVAEPTDDEVLSRPLYLEPVEGFEALDALTPQPRQVALRLR